MLFEFLGGGGGDVDDDDGGGGGDGSAQRAQKENVGRGDFGEAALHRQRRRSQPKVHEDGEDRPGVRTEFYRVLPSFTDLFDWL